jgi:hypothetical protein
VVRIYEDQIEILDPVRMEVIRRHPKSRRPGSLMMDPADRIFNPSRETDRLLAQAECIGPHTFDLCETWFKEEGRSGQRRMYALVNLVRHYAACHVEKAAEAAKRNGLRSSKAIRRIVESMAAEAAERKAEGAGHLTQEHALIRPGEDYAAFWDQHAAQAEPPAPPVAQKPVVQSRSIDPEQLREVWQQANWRKVIEVFQLSVDPERRSRDDEIWLRSPFTQEQRASMHVSLTANVYKDFSSGKGGGIIQFCREMLPSRVVHEHVRDGWVDGGPGNLHGIAAPDPTGNQIRFIARPARLRPIAIEVDLRCYLVITGIEPCGISGHLHYLVVFL